MQDRKLTPEEDFLGYITEVLVPEWKEKFLDKSMDYSSSDFSPHKILGEKGQFADIWRKIWKLKKGLWDGEDLRYEQPREILLDLIGHCFLAISEIDRTTDAEPQPATVEALKKAGATSEEAAVNMVNFGRFLRFLHCGEGCLKGHTYREPCANAEGA